MVHFFLKSDLHFCSQSFGTTTQMAFIADALEIIKVMIQYILPGFASSFIWWWCELEVKTKYFFLAKLHCSSTSSPASYIAIFIRSCLSVCELWCTLHLVFADVKFFCVYLHDLHYVPRHLNLVSFFAMDQWTIPNQVFTSVQWTNPKPLFVLGNIDFGVVLNYLNFMMRQFLWWFR